MRPIVKGLLAIGGIYITAMTINFFAKKEMAVARARSLVTNKGIINLGAGCSRSFISSSYCNIPEIVVNVDKVAYDGCPKCVQIDLETGSLPYGDRQFDVALASHVLEHLENWQSALTEWCRIADHVILVLPNPFNIEQLINPEHKRYFSYADVHYIVKHWPKVEVYT